MEKTYKESDFNVVYLSFGNLEYNKETDISLQFIGILIY
ncbi:MAG: hypothetical protein UR22_C0008G0040 [Parcubacteria group bacterium GW2011_GWC2_32_10]|nr:MAG: hypothetical protein UR22_C0008G0040 [Parcubacteria group bacterium GW2011_GWC2_32_10]